MKILGLHHVTAIADNAQRNHDFYTRVLGLRMVKKTVNFDDPGTYHFYFEDEIGTPGTILTFFPWEGIGQGNTGVGMATQVGYSIPSGSIDFWKERFSTEGITQKEDTIFGEQSIRFSDPDGLEIVLTETSSPDTRKGWATDEIHRGVALQGFHNVTLNLNRLDPTVAIITDLLGYQLQDQENNRYRFVNDSIETANVLDLIEDRNGSRGRNAAGTIHHVAFRVADDQILMEYQERIRSAGLSVTPKIDRDYFYSIYFREPGGVLFEIATDNPGFTRDEPVEHLGSALKLPHRYESIREKIEQVLPKL